jgi:TPR repeat protein
MTKFLQLSIVICFILALTSCQQINGPTDPSKQQKLAEAYFTGDGIVRNYEKAYFWALLATAQGENAYDVLGDIEDEYLSRRQVIEIQNKAQKWYNKHKK